MIDITSKSIKHLKQLNKLLHTIGINSWIEYRNYKVRAAGWTTVAFFFKEIKPKNNIQIDKYAGVAKWFYDRKFI